MGTTFTVFDNGESPKSNSVLPDGQNVRREMVAVAYVSKGDEGKYRNNGKLTAVGIHVFITVCNYSHISLCLDG